MKARNIFVIVLLNIFLLCMVSIIDEYLTMQERVSQLTTTVQNAVDSAIETSTASEEMFSNEFNNLLFSQGLRNSGSSALTQSTLRYYSSGAGSWVSGNTYIMSMYYNEHGYFPRNQAVYDNYALGKDSDTIYEWLFGVIGTSFYDDALDWANGKSVNTMYAEGSDRRPTSTFKEFYNAIGHCMTEEFYVKKPYVITTRGFDGTEAEDYVSYQIDTERAPTLTAMGLELNSYNSPNSSVTNDNFTSSFHIGKSANGTRSTYYLTPYSLGVTYIPKEVLLPAVLSHLDQLVRFHKSLNGGKANSGTYSDYASADGCVTDYTAITGQNSGIGWYVDDSGTVTNTQKSHRGRGLYNTNYTTRGTSIINDGLIEYDMSTVACKIDYFYIPNYYSDGNWRLVNFLEGSTPASASTFGNYGASAIRQTMGIPSASSARYTLPSRLANTDTSIRSNDSKSQRIVAKVTVKLNVHIPYKSGILTWFVSEFSNRTGINSNHFDARTWNPVTNDIDYSSDGLWYTYTTYYSVSR